MIRMSLMEQAKHGINACQLFDYQRVMDILLFTIVKSPGAVALTEATKNISKHGASIGRGGVNSWVLPDPDRYLSSVHTEIIYKNEKFFAIDQSTNGTFYNGSSEEIGKGNEVELRDGDRLILGDYEIIVTLTATDDEDLLLNGPFSSPKDIPHESIRAESPAGFHLHEDLIPFNDTPLRMTANQYSSNDQSLLLEDAVLDPMLAFATPASKNDVYSAGTQGDSANIMNHSMQFPEMIPDNWFDLPLPDLDEKVEIIDSPVTEMDYTPHDLHRNKLISEIGIVRDSSKPLRFSDKLITEKTSVNEKSRIQTPNNKKVNPRGGVEKKPPKNAKTLVSISPNEDLVAALGLNIQDMNDEQISEINDVVGEFTKIAVKGLMLILKSRSSLKSEFRMSVTTIQSAENNPLKFSPTLEDAMFNMFVRGGNAYNDPVTAVKDGIEGIADHQFSVFAGMRSAFNFLLERFNPHVLEAKFDKQKSSNLLASKKAKNWDLYTNFYQDIIKDRDDSFQYLFGDDFVQAYEQQMQQLKINRANNKE